VLREIRIATQLAKRVHAAHTMPFVAPVGKRPPEYQPGDQSLISAPDTGQKIL
jgi:hypothetical protein